MADPVERLKVVRREMTALKKSHMAEAGEVVTAAGDLAPPMLVGVITRAAMRVMQRLPQRSVNTVTTNVPGPQFPLYCLGREMVAYYPFVPLSVGVRVGTAILSYNGQLAFGVTGDFDTALAADGLVVPGVGAYAACMAGLTAIKGDRIIGRRLAGGRPVLGICVGMQVLFERGVEHGVETDGCDEWPGTVSRLQADVVPHMGWNTVEAPAGTSLFAGVEAERFYFVHSYAARAFPLLDTADPERMAPPLVTWSAHGGRFVAAVENGPLAATQFHPEKSGDAGAQLLENWVGSLV